jgi:hypothetical protein
LADLHFLNRFADIRHFQFNAHRCRLVAKVRGLKERSAVSGQKKAGNTSPKRKQGRVARGFPSLALRACEIRLFPHEALHSAKTITLIAES